MLQVLNDLNAKGNLFKPKLSFKNGQGSFQYRGVQTCNSASENARDYSLKQFKKYVAGTVRN